MLMHIKLQNLFVKTTTSFVPSHSYHSCRVAPDNTIYTVTPKCTLHNNITLYYALTMIRRR